MSVPRNMRCGRTQSCTENDPANSNQGARPREVFRGVTYTNLKLGLGVRDTNVYKSGRGLRFQSCTENDPENSNHGASPRDVFRGVTYTNLVGGWDLRI